jgi:Cu-Zn family superoxide dismutase
MRRTASSIAGFALVASLCTLTPAGPAPASPDHDSHGGHASHPSSERALIGRATLALADGKVIGDVTFTGGTRTTTVTVSVQMPGGRTALGAFHGLHIHANDDPSNGDGCVADAKKPPSTWFASADGHLITDARTHGVHAGDLPPLLINGDGEAYASSLTDRVILDELKGRAVVLHTQSDNLAHIPLGLGLDQYTANSPAAIDKTVKTGNGGDRIACGVIEILF